MAFNCQNRKNRIVGISFLQCIQACLWHISCVSVQKAAQSKALFLQAVARVIYNSWDNKSGTKYRIYSRFFFLYIKDWVESPNLSWLTAHTKDCKNLLWLEQIQLLRFSISSSQSLYLYIHILRVNICYIRACYIRQLQLSWSSSSSAVSMTHNHLLEIIHSTPIHGPLTLTAKSCSNFCKWH